MNPLTMLFASLLLAAAPPAAIARAADYAVGPQYDTTHVYVAREDFDAFVASLVATFGGTTSKQGVFQVTPTPSQTMSQLVLTPAGSISVFPPGAFIRETGPARTIRMVGAEAEFRF